MDLNTIEKNMNILNLIENIPSGLCICSTKVDHMEFIAWNKYMIEITGYTMDEINKLEWSNMLCNNSSLNDANDKINLFTDTEKEYEIICKNGITKTISISNSVITTEDSEENILALVKDITKNKQIEQELREIDERYKKILELSKDSIIIHNDEKYIYVNNNTFNLFDIEKPEDIIGQSIYKYVTPNFHNIVKNRIKTELETKGRVPIIEESLITSNGEVIDVEVASSYVPYKGEKCILTFIRNVSFRKRLEKQLRKSESMLLQVTENSLDMITISDTNGIIKYGTPSNTRILGYELKDFIGLNILDLVYPEELSYAETKLKKMKKTFQEETIQCSLKCKNGSYKFLEIIGKVLNSDEVIEGFIFSARDISDRKKVEKLEKDMKEKSRLLSEATEYERLRTEFFANLSHELRTPINIILSSLQLIDLKTNETTTTPWAQEELKKYPVIMKQNCYRLIRLINNLIDVTKIDSGYFSLNLINTNIVNVVEDITLSVIEYAKNKGISLIFDTEIEEKFLSCDPDKIERIILNLISNSLKFTESGGSILVKIIDNGESLIISVKDTGIGIPKDKQKIIFDRFVQVDKSLTRNREGSGIGLSLVKSLVELHKGTIAVRSELNKGSEFIITLPIQLIDEKNNVASSLNYLNDGHSEKVNIEFSDIYY